MDNLIRVLQIIGSMDVGGAETMIMNIYRKIDRSKVQFDFMVSVEKDCFYDNEINQLGGNIYHTVTKSTHPIKFSKDLWKLIKQNQYAIVHIHSSNAMAAIPLTISKLAGVEDRIVHSHNSKDSGNIRLHNVMIHVVNIMATRKFSCSDLASKWMYGDKYNEAIIINNPIDCHLFLHNEKLREKMRNSLGLKNEKTYIHVGRFSRQKNHNYLIDIFEEIHKQDPDSVLLLVGIGELQSKIKEKVYELNLNKSVQFMGIRSDVYNVLQACDCFLFPSLFEGLPLTLVEAQAAGLRCYISDVITKQVDITDLIKRISLKKPPKQWTEIILNDTDSIIGKEECNKLVYDLYDSTSMAKKFANEYYTI